MISFLYNPAIPSSITAPMVRVLLPLGLFLLADIVDASALTLKPFVQLQKYWNILETEGFHYLQIHHYMSSTFGSLQVSLPTPFERLCLFGTGMRGLISIIYRLLSTVTEGDVNTVHG